MRGFGLSYARSILVMERVFVVGAQQLGPFGIATLSYYPFFLYNMPDMRAYALFFSPDFALCSI